MSEEIIFIPPMDISQWNLSDIDKLVELKYSESDTLEFKESIPKDLEKDICGLANSSGGFIIFGLRGKDKAEEKVGISKTEEHDFNQKLTNKIAQIDPIPIIPPVKILEETDKFYAVLKIENTVRFKPFTIKNKGNLYVRLNGTTQPASRAIILNLFADSVERRQRLIILKNAIEILIRDIQLRENMGNFNITKKYMNNIPEVNTERLKDSIVNAGDLIFDLDETGKVDKSSTTGGLLTTVLPKIDVLNANITSFNNNSIGSLERTNSVQVINFFSTSEAIGVIDGLTKFQAAIEKLLNG